MLNLDKKVPAYVFLECVAIPEVADDGKIKRTKFKAKLCGLEIRVKFVTPTCWETWHHALLEFNVCCSKSQMNGTRTHGGRKAYAIYREIETLFAATASFSQYFED